MSTNTMDTPLPPPTPLHPRLARRQVPSGVLGMLIFVATEAMLFAGFISSFTVIRRSTMPGMWPPPGQPLLPAAQTGFNTALLLLSAVTLFVAQRRFRREPAQARHWLWLTLVLGAAFVAMQGVEWVALLSAGLTMTSSSMGAFFYMIVGAHALHAVAAIIILGYAAWALQKNALKPTAFLTAQVFWYFVVFLWPVLYARVYF